MRSNDSPCHASLLAPTQRLLDAIAAIAGDDVGVSELDRVALLFPRGEHT